MSSALYRTALKLCDVGDHELLANMAHQLAIEREMHEIGSCWNMPRRTSFQGRLHASTMHRPAASETSTGGVQQNPI